MAFVFPKYCGVLRINSHIETHQKTGGLPFTA